jgi:hypothetical protein
MTESVFALFVDVMGVQHDLVSTSSDSEASVGFARCRDRLEYFHGDLAYTIGQELPLLLMNEGISQPDFVAEFSDSAYIVGKQFASVAITALLLMRRALRHEYPLRGGIGSIRGAAGKG